MTDAKQVLEQMAKDVRAVVEAVDAGLCWSRMDPPNERSVALTADSPPNATGMRFKVICVRWVQGKHTGYEGFATVFSPNTAIIHLSLPVARYVYDKAAASLN